MNPTDEHGYAVDRLTQTVHRRYAPHAADLPKTRTLMGVEAHLAGGEPTWCRRCWPNYRKPRARKAKP